MKLEEKIYTLNNLISEYEKELERLRKRRDDLLLKQHEKDKKERNKCRSKNT